MRMYSLTTLVFLTLGGFFISSGIAANSNRNCSCGYYDTASKSLFTDSIILYFNETSTLPANDFVVESYENGFEKGWNAQYRQGASTSNVDLRNSTTDSSPPALDLYVNPTTADHLVVGGGIRTLRRDIFYGSFRTLVRSSPQWYGGSALSMVLKYNESETIEINQINPNDPSIAWVNMIVHEEFPDRARGVNFTTLTDDQLSPWDYVELRVDWSKESVKYFVGGKLYRTIFKRDDERMPRTPSALYLKHWSIGNYFSTQGPPAQRNVANIAWTRLFFNSSLASAAGHQSLESRCQVSEACAMDDMTLRGSSAYPQDATREWEQLQPPSVRRIVPMIFTIVSISTSACLLLNLFIRRLPWKKVKFLKKHNSDKTRKHSTPYYASSAQLVHEGGAFTSNSTAGSQTRILGVDDTLLYFTRTTPLTRTRAPSSEDLAIQLISVSPAASITQLAQNWPLDNLPHGARMSGSSARHSIGKGYIEGHDGKSEITTTGKNDNTKKTHRGTTVTTRSIPPTPEAADRHSLQAKNFDNIDLTTLPPSQSRDTEKHHNEKSSMGPGLASAPPSSSNKATTGLPAAKKRVDYLAGLVAVASLIVTGIHFALTFVPAAINPDGYIHYQSEVWARKTIDSILLNLIWIGPFLMTSTRFLVASYIKNGDISSIAQKIVGRPFRLLIPIMAISMLEYFCMDSGATKWLEYLPSITWSTWPFTVIPSNFATYLSEVLQLAFLIPNATPQITFNYCTGVLWTIPVQLQGSWVTLLGMIIICEIKTPWKRFGYYAICILTHWYALSWGTYFYCGILLTDLDVTYKWRKWLNERPMIYYPLLSLFSLMAFSGLGIDLLTQWTGVNYATFEYGVHPDPLTGLLISQTINAGYPQYYVPKLHGIIFSIGLQGMH